MRIGQDKEECDSFLTFTKLPKGVTNLSLRANKLISLILNGFAVNTLRFFTSLYTSFQNEQTILFHIS